MENEAILPPPDNLTEKGRPMADRRRAPATAGGPPRQPRPGSGRYGTYASLTARKRTGS